MKIKKSDVKTLLLFMVMVLFISCENFLDGSSLKESIERDINYASAGYAAVTIYSVNSATESISPANGSYTNKYKSSDKIDLSFTPTSRYQFIKWVAEPEDSVSFSDARLLVTTAEIRKIEAPITIKPLVYERSMISVAPENVVENPRNSAIVISFSTPMDISEEDLSKISITINEVSILDNYQPPKMNEEKNRITFVPRRDKLIEVNSEVKIVKVTVPKEFFFEKDGVKICLESDYSYSFKINSTTETNAEIAVSCSSTEGDLSYSGTKTYYLDDEFSVAVSPKEAYVLKGWSIKYDDGTYVGDDILETSTMENGARINVKILTGTSKAISITPNLVLRGSVIVNFKTDHGITVPSEQKRYYVGDTFSIAYREIGDFSFIRWDAKTSTGLAADSVQSIKIGTEVVDGETVDVYSSVGPYISFANKNDDETQCTILNSDESITIIAVCGERPSITGFSPESLSGVNRDSKITVLFSQPMSESSIYWTESELNSMGISGSSYDVFKAEGKTDSHGKQYYYAYQEKNKPETQKYKNIEIYERSTRKNLLRYYKEPFYESNENMSLIIPSEGGDKSVPAYTTVEVKISSSFESDELVAVNQKMVKTFVVNNGTDNTKPVMEISSLSISGMARSGEVGFITNPDATHAVGSIISGNIEGTDFQTRTPLLWNDQDSYADWETLPKVINSDRANHKLKINIKGKVTDGESKPAYLKVSLVPKRTDLHQVYKVYTQTRSLNSDGVGKSDFSSEGLEFEFNLRKSVYEGVYKIQISALDNGNNEQFFDKEYGFIYDDGLGPMDDGHEVVYPEGTRLFFAYERRVIREIAGQTFDPGIVLSSYVLNTTEDDYQVLISPTDRVTVLKPARKVAFSIQNLQNCEYCVKPSSGVQGEWIPTEQEYDLAEVYKDHDVDWWKPAPDTSNWRKTPRLTVRDVFGNLSPEYRFYMVYGDAPSLSYRTDGTKFTTPAFDIFSITGRGTVVTLDIKEKCSRLKRIYSEVCNMGSASYCRISGIEQFRKTYSYTAVDGYGCDIELDEPLAPNEGVISIGILFANLKYERETVSMRFRFEDTNGWISDWYEMLW